MGRQIIEILKIKSYYDIIMRITEVKGHGGQEESETNNTQITSNIREQKTEIVKIWRFSNSGLSPV